MFRQGARADGSGAARHPPEGPQEVRQEPPTQVRGPGHHRLLPRHRPLRRLHQ